MMLLPKPVLVAVKAVLRIIGAGIALFVILSVWLTIDALWRMNDRPLMPECAQSTQCIQVQQCINSIEAYCHGMGDEGVRL